MSSGDAPPSNGRQSPPMPPLHVYAHTQPSPKRRPDQLPPEPPDAATTTPRPARIRSTPRVADQTAAPPADTSMDYPVKLTKPPPIFPKPPRRDTQPSQQPPSEPVLTLDHPPSSTLPPKQGNHVRDPSNNNHSAAARPPPNHVGNHVPNHVPNNVAANHVTEPNHNTALMPLYTTTTPDGRPQSSLTDEDEPDLTFTDPKSFWGRYCTRRRVRILLVLLLFLVFFIIGIIVGAISRSAAADEVCLAGVTKRLMDDADLNVRQAMFDSASATFINYHMTKLTSGAHLSGTNGSVVAARHVLSVLAEIDTGAHFVEFRVKISHPPNSPASPEAYDPWSMRIDGRDAGAGGKTFTAEEDVVELSDIEGVPPFVAYPPAQFVRNADVIYVNYAREEDFRFLTENLTAIGLTIRGRIGLARTGINSPADKIRNGQRYGLEAIILYCDCDDHPDNQYPKGPSMPQSGAARATAYGGWGDPDTVGYPSLAGVHRTSTPLAVLPAIAGFSVSLQTAAILLSHSATVTSVPRSWRGTLRPDSYKIGGLKNKMTIALRTPTAPSSYLTRPITNVVATIRGELEPDRYVIVGARRDAWVTGAVDPVSGTASMLGLSRALRTAMDAGWKPRRTIILCSWDGGAYGALGAGEWVETNLARLAGRAVAYVNSHIAAEGSYLLKALASPTLHGMLERAMEAVSAGPTIAERTLLQFWRSRRQQSGLDATRPLLHGGWAETAPFLRVAGVPIVEFRFSNDTSDSMGPSYPVAGTHYDSSAYYRRFVDRNSFAAFTDIIIYVNVFTDCQLTRLHTQLLTETVRSLADSLHAPLDPRAYVPVLRAARDDLWRRYEPLLSDRNPYFGEQRVGSFSQVVDFFTESINQLERATNSFAKRLDAARSSKHPFLLRQLNDQLIGFERAMLDQTALRRDDKRGSGDRHLLLGVDQYNSYTPQVFPYVRRALDASPASSESVRRALSDAGVAMRWAASTLAEPGDGL